eukprot:m.415637 g.415637  ORF g.415637 m.415637 type:complete len:171 (+) comp16824_c1_seq11:176-688(+)
MSMFLSLFVFKTQTGANPQSCGAACALSARRLQTWAPYESTLPSTSATAPAHPIASDHPRDCAHLRRDAMNCIICLDDEGSVVQKGCCCRGDAGAVHTDCLIELAVHSTEHRHDVGPWERCETCDEPFTGATAMTLAKAWMDRTATMDPVAEERLIAQANLACLLSDELG